MAVCIIYSVVSDAGTEDMDYTSWGCYKGACLCQTNRIHGHSPSSQLETSSPWLCFGRVQHIHGAYFPLARRCTHISRCGVCAGPCLGEQKRGAETGVHAVPRLQAAEAPSRQGAECCLLVCIVVSILWLLLFAVVGFLAAATAAAAAAAAAAAVADVFRIRATCRARCFLPSVSIPSIERSFP